MQPNWHEALDSRSRKCGFEFLHGYQDYKFINEVFSKMGYIIIVIRDQYLVAQDWDILRISWKQMCNDFKGTIKIAKQFIDF